LTAILAWYIFKLSLHDTRIPYGTKSFQFTIAAKEKFHLASQNKNLTKRMPGPQTDHGAEPGLHFGGSIMV